MNDKDSAQLEQSASPSDRMKNVVISRYEKTENLYVEQNRIAFVYSCKALCNGLKQFISQRLRDEIDRLTQEEEKKLKKLYREEDNRETRREKSEEIRFEYAEKKFDLSAELLTRSSIVTRDIEVDFEIPEDPEEIRKLQKIIASPIKREKNERIY